MFQTETLGSDFHLRRANIYGIVCKSLRCKITLSSLAPGDTTIHPFAHPLPHSTQNEFFTFTVFLSTPQQFIHLWSETKVYFRALSHFGHKFVSLSPKRFLFNTMVSLFFLFFLPTIQAGKILKKRGPQEFSFPSF
ncbi:hypothetical protein CDAR_96991 [Caerostris darwini]|uniref:Uncharacterized protein n=1 Tax=Caerostris darwini TaxID=1538125 RepID=A0AAV4T833_9ARAC|nr:hypothetical protein CDAR_96991 [Caerostris darwini]